MGILCIFIGILFFMNPSFRMLDYMPDLIGCIFIIAGTTKLSYIDHRIEGARKLTCYLAAVSALKIPLSLYFSVYEKGYLLPGTFIFSVLEAMLMIGIFTSLFGGLEYLVSREDHEYDHFKNAENASVICFVFSIARAVLSFVPELFSLGAQKDSFQYSYSPTPEQNAVYLKVYAEFLAFIIIFIFGIYFSVVCGKYFIKLARDKELVKALHSRYDLYIEENIPKIHRKRIICALSIFFFAILFLYNQILDYVNVIPNTLSFIFMIIGSVYLIVRFDCKRLKKVLPLYIPLTVLSIYNNIVQYKLLSATDIDFYFDKMFIKDVPALLKSTDALPSLILPIVIEYLIFAILAEITINSLMSVDFMGDKDTVSIFRILFSITGIVYFASSAYVYFGQFIRTIFTYMTESLDVYIKYDSILSICEWTSLISFFMLIYFSYKLGTDIMQQVHCDNKESENS